MALTKNLAQLANQERSSSLLSEPDNIKGLYLQRNNLQGYRVGLRPPPFEDR